MARITYTGNEVDCFLNGIRVDLLQTIRGSDGYGHEPVSGVGDIHVREHVPTVARHTITISKFAMLRENAVAAGIILENGDAAMRGREFPIEIFSKAGPLLKKWDGAVNDGGDVQVNAHRIVVLDATFLARDAAGSYAVA